MFIVPRDSIDPSSFRSEMVRACMSLLKELNAVLDFLVL
jgi:hypothetical protein